MNRVAVVGAGTMGNGIAHVFAQSGCDVRLIDVSQEIIERGLATIRRNMDRQIKKEKLTTDGRDAALDRIDTSTDVGAIDGAELIVEAIAEKPDLKFDLFREMDAVAGQGVILATNTSSISITEIAAQTKR
ncbi:MAG: NAD-binding protein, partial [Gemmatimonadetes bacterium]|nr:NAD-binding protein [Gemmatimonadota bacterium]